jgi:signal transduction histidine kinase/ActR/RegA family two-component response regulator
VYEKYNIPDSAYYFLSLQANLIDASYLEQNELLVSRYIKKNTNGNNNVSTIGLSQIQVLFLIGSLVLLLILLIYFLLQQKRFNKVKAEKNQELEIANAKLKEFNASVNQKVISNTSVAALELEKSNKVVIELRKSLKKAEESNYLKNTFLGSMSHQIRTPLNGIMGFSDMLETELAVIGNEELFDYAKNIHESGSKLMSMITNIFDISNIEANILELNIIECNINDIISDVEKENLLKANEKGINYKTKLGSGIPSIIADVNSLVKVLNIVIDNAIKYTSKGFVAISSTSNADDTITVRIADKGIGIDNEVLSALNDSFDHKKNGSLSTYQNSGLGLILAHRLIDLMNGKLEIISKPNVGTEVSIILPCAVATKDSEELVANPTQSIFDLGKIKIFIVEDDRMNRLILEKMLKKSGEIVTAIDGPDTLAIIEKSVNSNNIFDIMLFDINLPQPWDGIKLMHEVKKRFPAYKNIPFIAQTAYAMVYDKDTYLEAGFNDYIAKPINKTELITMIQKQLELHG